MFQKFYTNTLESKFIQSILNKTYIPNIRAVGNGDYVYEGKSYIYDSSIIFCTKNGVLNSYTKNTPFVSNSLVCSNVLVVNDNVPNAEYDVVRDYIPGEKINGVSQNYVSNHNYYDGETHKHLGDYLRYLKNMNGIDLMPFYNCYCDGSIDKFFLDKNSQYCINIKKNNQYKVVNVPIKFNKKYTIAIDSTNGVDMKSVFIGNYGVINNTLTSGDKMLSVMREDNGEYITSKKSTQFRKPFIYSISTNNDELMQYEKYLNLVIQLPNNNTSSIVVIEGDNSSNNVRKIINIEYSMYLDNDSINNAFISELSLLQINDRNIYAFSNRLIEYLLLNVIDSSDTISDNIIRVNDYANIKTKYNFLYSNDLRNYVFNKSLKESYNKFDLNGFVDKDTEKILTKGRNV